VFGGRAVAKSCMTIALALSSIGVWAQSESPPASSAEPQASAPQGKKPSPWLFTPVFTSNPKLGTTVGATGGYITRFDAESRPSIFAASAQYSNTGSIVAGAFARTSSTPITNA